jgi:hypothetical protein
MVFMIFISFVLLILPLVFFLGAAIAEVRSHQKEAPFFFLRIAEIAAGLADGVPLAAIAWLDADEQIRITGGVAMRASRKRVPGLFVVLQRRISSLSAHLVW